jgi:hypothetical protein
MRNDFDPDFLQSRESLGAVQGHFNRPKCYQSGMFEATFARPQCTERLIQVPVPHRGPCSRGMRRLDPYSSANYFWPIKDSRLGLHLGGSTQISSTGMVVYEPSGPYNAPEYISVRREGGQRS